MLIILGSGFGAVAEQVAIQGRLDFAAIPGFAAATAPTHSGRLIWGTLGRQAVLVMQGRLHVYEGHSAAATVLPVRAAAALGVEAMISTSLSGAIRADLNVGDFMRIQGHIDLGGGSGAVPAGMSAVAAGRPVYDRRWTVGRDIPCTAGVLAYLCGPSFETPAELRMLRRLGADAVGWSLVPEAAAAAACGLRVLGLTCISDISDPDRPAPVDLEALYAVGPRRQAALATLMIEALHGL